MGSVSVIDNRQNNFSDGLFWPKYRFVTVGSVPQFQCLANSDFTAQIDWVPHSGSKTIRLQLARPIWNYILNWWDQCRKVYTIVVSGWVGVQNRVLYQVQMIFCYFDKNTLYLGKFCSFGLLWQVHFDFCYCDKYILLLWQIHLYVWKNTRQSTHYCRQWVGVLNGVLWYIKRKWHLILRHAANWHWACPNWTFRLNCNSIKIWPSESFSLCFLNIGHFQKFRREWDICLTQLK